MTEKNDDIKSVDKVSPTQEGTNKASAGPCDCGSCDCSSANTASSSTSKVSDVKSVRVQA